MGINTTFLVRVWEPQGAGMLSEKLPSHSRSGKQGIRLPGERLGCRGQAHAWGSGDIKCFPCWMDSWCFRGNERIDPGPKG